jgi:hypothetical protein
MTAEDVLASIISDVTHDDPAPTTERSPAIPCAECETLKDLLSECLASTRPYADKPDIRRRCIDLFVHMNDNETHRATLRLLLCALNDAELENKILRANIYHDKNPEDT